VTDSLTFSEANGPWRPIPEWAQFLIQFGYRWPEKGKRRIALISMPCDSPGAGLIALGSMVRDLGNSSANAIDGHYDALLRYARQYLESCRNCELEHCNPTVKGCGYTSRARGKLRSLRVQRTTVEISERTNVEERRLTLRHRRGMLESPNPEYATDWHIDGEPPPQSNLAGSELSSEPYQHLIDAAQIVSENLRRTYSGICLAGRAAGESASRAACSAVRFQDGVAEFGLEKMLTVHGWSAGTVSRVSFFNTRTAELDRYSPAPSLVVADGDIAFLKTLGRPEFQQSDIVGVINRAVDRDGLEAVGNKVLGLRQWYDPDEDLLDCPPAALRGISVAILRRR